mgnify:CR=1 FL=1
MARPAALVVFLPTERLLRQPQHLLGLLQLRWRRRALRYKRRAVRAGCNLGDVKLQFTVDQLGCDWCLGFRSNTDSG